MTHDGLKIVFYGLSTCPYCRQAKEYLDKHSIPYELIYVDKLAGKEREDAIADMRGYNPALSFPCIVIFESSGKHKTYVGFTHQAREAVDALR